MVELQFADKSQWLTLRDACRLLDVSQAALRQWADGGHLRVYRTPGGHRRFFRDDVMAFTGFGSSSPDPNNSDALEGSALRRIRSRLHQQSVASQTWHSSMDSEGRFRMRLFGRRLLTLLAQETPSGHRRQEALTEAYQLGRQYGSEMAEKSVSLKDTVEAFIFFRTMVLESADSGAWTRILELADRVLVGVTESYEDRLSSLNVSGPNNAGPNAAGQAAVAPPTQ